MYGLSSRPAAASIPPDSSSLTACKCEVAGGVSMTPPSSRACIVYDHPSSCYREVSKSVVCGEPALDLFILTWRCPPSRESRPGCGLSRRGRNVPERGGLFKILHDPAPAGLSRPAGLTRRATGTTRSRWVDPRARWDDPAPWVIPRVRRDNPARRNNPAWRRDIPAATRKL